ncbi:MAG: hypothetical protein MJE68_27755, partial [Proteobacteria bacterium]|nr:hypothetical protein [Pseudomonadota bacterium]
DGTVVPGYDWTSCLSQHIGKFVGIKSFHHLRFSSSHNSSVFVREKSDSPEVEMKLLKDDWTPPATDLPERVAPTGLSLARQWYLFNKIREFCPKDCKDVTCPKPGEPEPESNPDTSTTPAMDPSDTPGTSSTSTSTTPAGPRAKKQRLCGVYKQQGHNAHSCPSRD